MFPLVAGQVCLCLAGGCQGTATMSTNAPDSSGSADLGDGSLDGAGANDGAEAQPDAAALSGDQSPFLLDGGARTDATAEIDGGAMLDTTTTFDAGFLPDFTAATDSVGCTFPPGNVRCLRAGSRGQGKRGCGLALRGTGGCRV